MLLSVCWRATMRARTRCCKPHTAPILSRVVWIHSYRCSFFRDGGNVFDFVLVLCGVADAVVLTPLASTSSQTVGVATALRVLRVIRVLRLARLAILFEELHAIWGAMVHR